MLQSTTGGEADDGGARGAGAEPAVGAGDSVRAGRADHDRAAFRRLRVLLRACRENYGDGCDAQVGELVGVSERVAAQVDGEAVLVRFFDRLAVGEIGEHVVVRKGEAAAAPVRIRDCAKGGAIDRRLVVAREIAGDVVAPKFARLQRADDVEEFIEPVDADVVHNCASGGRPVEERPDEAAECAVFCVAETRKWSGAAFLEGANTRARSAWAGGHHDGTGDGIRRAASDKEFVHVLSPSFGDLQLIARAHHR